MFASILGMLLPLLGDVVSKVILGITERFYTWASEERAKQLERKVQALEAYKESVERRRVSEHAMDVAAVRVTDAQQDRDTSAKKLSALRDFVAKNTKGADDA